MFSDLLKQHTRRVPVAYRVVVSKDDIVLQERMSKRSEYKCVKHSDDFDVYELMLEPAGDLFTVPLFVGSTAHVFYADKSEITLSDIVDVGNDSRVLLMTDEQCSAIAHLKRTLRDLSPFFIAMLAVQESIDPIDVPPAMDFVGIDETADAIRNITEFLSGTIDIEDLVTASGTMSLLRKWAAAGIGQANQKYYPSVQDDVSMCAQRLKVTHHEVRNLEGEEERYVLAVVLEPNDGSDGNDVDPDGHGNIYNAAEVRAACHWYAENGGKKGYMHGLDEYDGYLIDKEDESIVVIENYIIPVDIPEGAMHEEQERIKAGTWMMGFRVNSDEIWDKVKSGEVDGVSVGMLALKQPLKR